LYLSLVLLFCKLAAAQTQTVGPSVRVQPVDKKVTINSLEHVDVEAGVSVEHLSKGFGSWREAYLSASKKFRSGQAVYGIYRRTQRSGQNDSEMTVGLYQPIDKRWTIFVEGSASPKHRILPIFSTLLQIEHSFNKGWGAQVGWRHTQFNTAHTNTGIFTAERYFSAYRAAYTLHLTNLAGVGTTAAHRFQLTRYYSEKNSVSISFAAGPEVEDLGRRILRTGVQSIAFGGRHWVSQHLAVMYNYGFTRQGSIYTRQGFNFGIQYRL
jgi:YaiO family outer membrane protein